MIDDKYRVLQLNSGSSTFGGVSSFLYNVYIHIDHEKLQFDFISPNKTTYNIHRDDIINAGGNIYELRITGNFLTRKIKLYTRLKKFLKQHNYKVIHINSGNFFFNIFAVKAAKKSGIEYRIVHSHNAGDTSQSNLKKWLFNFFKPCLERNATDLFACSKKAAEYMYTKTTCQKGRVIIIKNGIDVDRFDYNEDVRKCGREHLHANDKLIIGNVGRFEKQKNHTFLIKIFREIHKIVPNSILLLFGTGPTEAETKRLVNDMKLENCVYFMGTVDNIEIMYQVMDVFILPSYYEGLPISVIEAQTSSLPCLLSDTITREVKISDNVEFLSLNVSLSVWAKTAISMAHKKRKSGKQNVLDAGYSINSVAKKLQEYYVHLFK